MFGHLNALNLSMQGKHEYVLSFTDKTTDQPKIILWNKKIKEGNISRFVKVAESQNETLHFLICNHLTSLHEEISHYFPEILIESYDWIRNPFVESTHDLNLSEEKELFSIRNDRSQRLKHSEISINSFYVEL